MTTTETKDEKKKESTETKKNETDPIIEAIEEDDEFEEFEPCNWGKKDEDSDDAKQWQVSLPSGRYMALSYTHVLFYERIIGMMMILKMILLNIYELN